MCWHGYCCELLCFVFRQCCLVSDNTAYIALSKQSASMRNLEVVANNVANANANGFRKDTMLFSHYTKTGITDDNVFAQDIGTIVDTKTQGEARYTNNSLDCMIVGDGFFQVQAENGIRYTRAGNLHINRENVLVTSGGHPVLSLDGTPTVFEFGDPAPVISADGIITVDGDIRGSIGIFEFMIPEMLRKGGDGLLVSDEEPLPAVDYQVLQGAVESSNVNEIYEVTKLVELQRYVSVTNSLLTNYYSNTKNVINKIARVGG